MGLSWGIGVQAAGLVFRAAGVAVRIWQQWKWRNLEVHATPIKAGRMLKAYDVRLTNKSDAVLHLESVQITSPRPTEMGFRWHFPKIYFLGDPVPEDPWETGYVFPINYDLPPNKEFGFDVGIPPSFAISPSRSSPVVITISFVARGWKERQGRQHLVRSLRN